MRRVAVLLVLLGGCPICQCDYQLRVVSGSEPLAPSDELVLELSSEGFTAGPDRCGGHWYVDNIEGGTGLLGTVTTCGVYTAPAAPPDHDVLVEASEYPAGTCADCCPYGQHLVRLAR